MVDGADTVKVRIHGKEYEAKIIGADRLTDIALLKVDGVTNLTPVYTGDSDKVKVGDWAIAIGNPFGLEHSFTVGVVSAVARRDVDMTGNPQIQTDAAINQGNSGGPLINIDGEVIGVNRMIQSPNGGNIGLGFAIPINTVMSVIDSLKKNGKVIRGFIGISPYSFNEQEAERFNLGIKQGALVIRVQPGSPAARAGVKKKDVITRLGGEQVTSAADLYRAVGNATIGNTLTMEVWRNKKMLKLKIKIEERPKDS